MYELDNKIVDFARRWRRARAGWSFGGPIMSTLENCLEQVTASSGDQEMFAELYRQILGDSLEQRASAIHLHFATNRLHVRYRVDDKLQPRCSLPVDAADSLLTAIKSHARMDPSERRRPQDGSGTYPTAHGNRSIHVSFVPASQGPSATLRWVDVDLKCRQLHELGLLPAQRSVLDQMLQQRTGFVVAGSCGFSGRRTMGHAMLLAAKEAGKDVISLEWGVTRLLPRVLQCELSSAPDYSQSRLHQALLTRAALRRQPDVVFVEHPGNEENIGHVLAAARNSCLVIAVMGRHFEQLIEYLAYLGVPLCVSTKVLLGAIEQRLMPRVCARCAMSYAPQSAELRDLRIRCDNARELVFVKSLGCPACRGTGRDGVVGIHEVATMTENLREMFLQSEPSGRIRQALLDGGMATYYESALHKLVTRQVASTTVFAHFGYWRTNPTDWIDVDAATGLRRA
jgi:type II secretory ATPase GspE/PulE/Tfp pilus assembly ATPase PilB-like protein